MFTYDSSCNLTGAKNPKHWLDASGNLTTPNALTLQSMYTDCGRESENAVTLRSWFLDCKGISDCASKNTGTTITLDCVTGDYTWQLIARVTWEGYYYEVWQDNSGLIWSDVIMDNNYNAYFNWCVASGANGATGNIYDSTDPVDYGYCNNSTYQQQGASGILLPISLCYSDSANLWTPEWTNKSKGNLTELTWYLPTAEDYLLAKKHGIRRIFEQKYSGETWTSTVSANDARLAWIFVNNDGTINNNLVGRVNGGATNVRCVAHPPN
jgi:hypothetical protein